MKKDKLPMALSEGLTIFLVLLILGLLGLYNNLYWLRFFTVVFIISCITYIAHKIFDRKAIHR